MANKKILYVIIVVLVVGGGLFFFLNNKNAQKGNETGQQTTSLPAAQTPADDKTMVDCGQAKDPGCFLNRMNGCLPVTVQMTGSDNTTKIEMTILGIENDKCHFQRKINDSLNLDCFFPKGTMNWDTIDQTFGNDKGLQKVVDDACTLGGW